MKRFEELKTTVNEHELKIVEFPDALGFHLSKKAKDGKYCNIGGGHTLQTCKELALKMYGVPRDRWQHSHVEYLKSFIANVSGNKPGYTFRIVETKIEGGHLCGEGAYLYGFDKNKYQEYDYGQNTIKACKEFAWEEFDIPLDAWREEVT